MKTFDDLQNLGANVIHEQTHIARSKLELVLNKSFADLTRVQFMGFISILEREYGIDLSGIRQEYDEFVQSHPDVVIQKESVILQAQSRSRQKWILGGVVAITLLIVIGSMIQGRLSIAPSEDVIQLSSGNVEVVDANLGIVPVEINTTVIAPIVEANTTALKSELNISTKSVATIENAVSIKPTVKVWIGILDLTTGTKSQKTTTDPIVLDKSKNTLYMFGHGRLEILTPNGTKILKDRNAVWFTYENGQLKQINEAEFSVKNNGVAW
ncbi:MAG: hypothetical protein Q8N01_05070 [Sulfuricurvum sp.]|nr:hypothetical protein [Sulfuricurvum sp.]MDP3022955.1 hypothetical protein [Sulfuricurvum sp.]MDP3119764.1 hypothetical protein [Sulfuricurvum sp.]